MLFVFKELFAIGEDGALVGILNVQEKEKLEALVGNRIYFSAIVSPSLSIKRNCPLHNLPQLRASIRLHDDSSFRSGASPKEVQEEERQQASQ